MAILRLSSTLGVDSDFELQSKLFGKLKKLEESPDNILIKSAKNFLAWDWVLYCAASIYGDDMETALTLYGQDRLLKELLLSVPYTHTAAKLKIHYYTLTRVLRALRLNENVDISLGLGLKLLEILGQDTLIEITGMIENSFDIELRQYINLDCVNRFTIFGEEGVPQIE